MRHELIDAWMQHPSASMLADPMFDSLRRWSRGSFPEGEIPLSWTLERMDNAGVSHGLLSAWWGPAGPLVSNDDVGGIAREFPERFSAVVSADLHRPMDAIRELRRCVSEYGARGLRIVPWLWELPPDRLQPRRRRWPCVRWHTPAAAV